MEQKMVYLVTQDGWEGGDYGVVAVFDNKGDAEIFSGGYDSSKVRECPLNPDTPIMKLLKGGGGVYIVKMAFDGSIISVDRRLANGWEIDGGLVVANTSIHPGFPHYDFVSTHVIARDEQHAREIAEGRGEQARQCARTIPGLRRERAEQEAEWEVKNYADGKFRHAVAMERDRRMHEAMRQQASIPTVQGSSAPVGMLPDYIPPEPVKPEPVTEKHVQAAYDKLFGKCLPPEVIAEMAKGKEPCPEEEDDDHPEDFVWHEDFGVWGAWNDV